MNDRVSSEIDWAITSLRNARISLDLLCARSLDAKLLREELREIQPRLGTPDEKPSDRDRVADIAHKLNNMLCGV